MNATDLAPLRSIPALRATMEKEPDVTRVIAIRPSQKQPDRYQYWIDTYYRTRPTHEIGETNARFLQTDVQYRNEQETAAKRYWDKEPL
ncbi:MAG: hypothetical protein LBK99_14305 [Opitutaceae bacterium]|jgi:hypothetical protein|nr:hypothetical protein [Opitutaceae bacterium]